MNKCSVPIIVLWITCDRFILECSTCFKPEEELKICTYSNNFTKIPRLGVGYDFGFGSINDTEEMCMSKWHIKVLDCMKAKVNVRCENIQFYRIIWEFTLDTERLQRGVNYLCQEHNLRIFNEYRTKCFVEQENEAQLCVKDKGPVIAEAIKSIENRSQDKFDNKIQYYNNIRLILNNYECKASKMKLECLYNLLHNRCPPDAVRLILNYFRETLPSNCHFNYEQQLQTFLDSVVNTTISSNPIFERYKNDTRSVSVMITIVVPFIIVILLHFLDMLSFP